MRPPGEVRDGWEGPRGACNTRDPHGGREPPITKKGGWVEKNEPNMQSIRMPWSQKANGHASPSNFVTKAQTSLSLPNKFTVLLSFLAEKCYRTNMKLPQKASLGFETCETGPKVWFLASGFCLLRLGETSGGNWGNPNGPPQVTDLIQFCMHMISFYFSCSRNRKNNSLTRDTFRYL